MHVVQQLLRPVAALRLDEERVLEARRAAAALLPVADEREAPARRAPLREAVVPAAVRELARIRAVRADEPDRPARRIGVRLERDLVASGRPARIDVLVRAVEDARLRGAV